MGVTTLPSLRTVGGCGGCGRDRGREVVEAFDQVDTPDRSDIGIVGWPLRCRIWRDGWEWAGHIGEPVESPSDGFELVGAVP